MHHSSAELREQLNDILAESEGQGLGYGGRIGVVIAAALIELLAASEGGTIIRHEG